MENQNIDVSSGNDVSGNDVSGGDMGNSNNNSDVVQAIESLNESVTNTSIDYSPALAQIQTELVEIKENTSGSMSATEQIGMNVTIIVFFLIISWGYKRVKTIMRGLRENE